MAARYSSGNDDDDDCDKFGLDLTAKYETADVTFDDTALDNSG